MATSGALEPEIAIRSIDLLPEMREVEELQKEVWGPDDLVPLTHLVAALEVGGILVGAFDAAGQLVGFVYGFVGLEGGESVIHSHMLAVKESHRDQDLGYKLKLAQREIALARGFARITWTFDPLQSRNAHLNFGKLGVVADKYKINFYGEESASPLHRHIGTDRLWVSWLLNGSRVHERLERSSKPGSSFSDLGQAIRLVRSGPDGAPHVTGMANVFTRKHIAIEIPARIGSMQQHNPEIAVRWREATRRAFTAALAAGYLVEEFYRQTGSEPQTGVYLLSAGKEIEDFV